MIIRAKQRGFVLMTVVVAITLVAVIAVAISYQSVSETATSAGERQRDQLRYLAEAGMAHARLQLAQNSSCTAYGSIPTTTFGSGSYSVAINPSDNSPVAISAFGLSQDGAQFTLRNDTVHVYQPQTTTTFQPGASGTDSYIRDGANDSNNFGASAILKINNSSGEEASLLQFDLSGIPSGAEILSASLELWLEGGVAVDTGVIDLHRLTQAWVEGDKDGQAPPAGAGATYNSYNGQTNWASAGGDFVALPLDSTTIKTLTPAWYQWDLTPTAQDWVSGTASNEGLLLRASAGNVQKIFFTSSDGAAAQRPKLTVAYACECGEVCSSAATTPLPIAHWKFDDGGGSVAVDSVGGHDGTLVNGPVWGSGQHGGALDFDGSNDYVDVPNSDNLNLTSKFTVAAWIRNEAPSLSGSYRVISNEQNGSNGNFWVSIQAGKLWVGVGGQFFSPPNIFNADAWYHIAVSFDDDANRLLIHVDGEQVLDQSTTATLTPSGTPLYIATNWEGSKFWIGQIDDVRIYDQVLESADIAELAIRPAGGNRLLFVVASPSSLTNAETSYRVLFEGRGYTVQVIDDDANQGEFDTVTADNDVAFVSSDVDSRRLGSKLSTTPIGVVNAKAEMTETFGIGQIGGSSKSNSIIIGYPHYITSPFSNGALPTSLGFEELAHLSSTVAPDLLPLARSSSGISLAALELGATTSAGRTSAGRRVQYPWAGSGFDPNSLNSNGRTLLHRAVEWAAGAGGGSDGLLAHWKLDDGSGSIAQDSIGGHDGTLVDEPSWAAGQIDGGLMFSGSNDYVDVPHSGDLALNAQMTFTAWVNASSFGSSYQTVLSRDVGDSGSNYWFGTWQGELVFGFWSGGFFREVATSSLSLDEDTWYHLAASFDGTTDDTSLYVNGVLVHEGKLTFDPATPTAPVWIGGSIDGEYWDGLLDDVRIYDQALSATTIAALGAKAAGGGRDTACDGSFRDDFNAQTFSGDDGTLSWSGDWIEVGESDGPLSGDEQVVRDLSEFQLRLQDNNNGGEGVEREADLSDADKAELHFDYRRNGLDTAGDYVSIEVSSDGDNWTEIARIEGSGTDTEYKSDHQDISDFISTSTKIRFKTSSTMGNSDIVFFDNIEISCEP